MELILADKNYLDVERIRHAVIDIDLGDTNDFVLKIRRAEYKTDYQADAIVYAPNTEYGGILGEIDTDTSLDTITFQGYTWRGMLDKRIIEPASGEDYATASGELNTIIRGLVDSQFGGLIVGATASTGVTISSYQFDRYCTLLEGVTKMLKSVNYKPHIQIVQQGLGRPNYVEVSASPIVDYSDEIELSQDSRLNFKFENIYNGVNHLICLGQGELKERQVVHLYVQADGSIGSSQYFTGLKEIAAVYDYSSAEDMETLTTQGTERLQELMNSQSFEMNVAKLDLEVEIGDIIGGRDYLTGLYLKQPVANKIWRQDNGTESIIYKVEGTL